MVSLMKSIGIFRLYRLSRITHFRKKRTFARKSQHYKNKWGGIYQRLNMGQLSIDTLELANQFKIEADNFHKLMRH